MSPTLKIISFEPLSPSQDSTAAKHACSNGAGQGAQPPPQGVDSGQKPCNGAAWRAVRVSAPEEFSNARQVIVNSAEEPLATAA
ncbi:hypothetical protein MTOK_21700 [Mycolicibacterium tokaiense]|nr:hypothetical protein MTOK_21700 [Mycolicibacterium tokaiense]